MSRITELALALAIAAVVLLGTAEPNRDTEADQITADVDADLAAESAQLHLALYVAEHETARAAHPSAKEPTRRRHPSTLPENDQ